MKIEIFLRRLKFSLFPDLVVMNETEAQEWLNISTTTTDDSGFVLALWELATWNIYCKMDFSNYPLDKQVDFLKKFLAIN